MEPDADEPALLEAETGAVAVAKRRAPRPVVGIRQAGHQARLDPAAVADDQGGVAVRHGLGHARPEDPVRLGDPDQPTWAPSSSAYLR
jgi:hypothetical protein